LFAKIEYGDPASSVNVP